ncbi:MFS transporter, partial [Streptococcus pyogenes]
IAYSWVLLIINGANPVLEKIAVSSPYSYGKIRIWGTIGFAIGTQISGLIYDYISPQAIFVAFILAMILSIFGTLGTEKT